MTKHFLDIIYFGVYVIASAFGLYKLKQASVVVSSTFVLGFACYAVGFLLWIVILRRLPLSIAFPVAAGSLIVASQVVGWWLLSESIDMAQILGVLLILAGASLIYARVVT